MRGVAVRGEDGLARLDCAVGGVEGVWVGFGGGCGDLGDGRVRLEVDTLFADKLFDDKCHLFQV